LPKAFLWKGQADRMSLGTLSMARNIFVYFESYQLENRFVLNKFESYQCRSLAPIR
jgi:hypothetical protein